MAISSKIFNFNLNSIVITKKVKIATYGADTVSYSLCNNLIHPRHKRRCIHIQTGPIQLYSYQHMTLKKTRI